MEKHCIRCHGSAGDLSLREFNFTWYDDNSDEIQNDIVDEMIVRMEDQDDPMPPVSKRRDPMTQQEIDIIKEWQEGGLQLDSSNETTNPFSVVMDALDASGLVLMSKTKVANHLDKLEVSFEKDGVESVRVTVLKSDKEIQTETFEVTGIQSQGTMVIREKSSK